MPRTAQVLCDACGKDLTTTGNCVDYRLCLANESIPQRGGAVTLMGIYPKIKQDAYFCGVPCLQKWMEATYPVDQREAYRRWHRPESLRGGDFGRARFRVTERLAAHSIDPSGTFGTVVNK